MTSIADRILSAIEDNLDEFAEYIHNQNATEKLLEYLDQETIQDFARDNLNMVDYVKVEDIAVADFNMVSEDDCEERINEVRSEYEGTVDEPNSSLRDDGR